MFGLISKLEPIPLTPLLRGKGDFGRGEARSSFPRFLLYCYNIWHGAVVHSGERRVCIAKVRGSNPLGSTMCSQKCSKNLAKLSWPFAYYTSRTYLVTRLIIFVTLD